MCQMETCYRPYRIYKFLSVTHLKKKTQYCAVKLTYRIKQQWSIQNDFIFIMLLLHYVFTFH